MSLPDVWLVEVLITVVVLSLAHLVTHVLVSLAEELLVRLMVGLGRYLACLPLEFGSQQRRQDTAVRCVLVLLCDFTHLLVAGVRTLLSFASGLQELTRCSLRQGYKSGK